MAGLMDWTSGDTKTLKIISSLTIVLFATHLASSLILNYYNIKKLKKEESK